MHDSSLERVFDSTPAATADPTAPPPQPASNSLCDKFPLPPPAASRRTTAILSADTIIRLTAQFILRLIVTGEARDFSAEDVRQNVPEFTDAYTKANILGTLLGKGVHGTGLDLARGPGGRFLASYENACRVIHRLDQGAIDAVADSLGITIEELTAAIAALPRLEGNSAAS